MCVLRINIFFVIFGWRIAHDQCVSDTKNTRNSINRKCNPSWIETRHIHRFQINTDGTKQKERILFWQLTNWEKSVVCVQSACACALYDVIVIVNGKINQRFRLFFPILSSNRWMRTQSGQWKLKSVLSISLLFEGRNKFSLFAVRTRQKLDY